MKYDPGAIAATWWHRLQPDPAHGQPGDRATLARLRRVATPTEAAMEPACVALARALDAREAEFEIVAVAAAVLAHVRKDLGAGKVARLIGIDGVSPVRWLRVRRLLQAETPEDRLIAFRLLVQQMGNEAPLRDLAGCLLDWSETRRRNFVFDFHSPPLPAASASASATQEIVS